MTLAASIANWYHQFTQVAYVDGKPVVVVSGTIDYGYDSVVGAVSLTLKELYPWMQYAKEVTVFLGWDGYTQQAARALLQAKQPDWFPLNNEIQAVGYLSRARKGLAAIVTYSSQTDTAIVTDLLSESNVPYVDIDGAGTTLATVKDIVVSEEEEPFSTIETIDKITGYKTFESAPDGVVRRRLITVGIPAAGYAYSYEEGVNETHIRRLETIERILNRTKVTGLAGESISTTRRADSPYVDRDYTYTYSSDWIQTQAISDSAALLFESENNRVVDELEITTPLDPRVQPGQTCRALNASIGISSWTHYYIKHVNHSWGDGGAWSKLTVEGGTGQAGYQYAEPEAMFEFTVTRETVEIGGVPTNIYTVMCDAALSYDPDGSIASYSWSNNKNADVGTAVTYATYFTQAQMDNATLPAITLTVTDNDGNTNSLTVDIDQTIETILMQNLQVAASVQGESTPDGGAGWDTYAPGGGVTVTATPQIGADDYQLFGLSNGKLMHSDDSLATAPTEAHDFGSQVNCIWVNEMNPDRVAVGLANGQIQATANMSDVAASTWTTLTTLGAAVNWIVESPYQMGQYWACSGSAVYLTFDSFGSSSAHISWGSGTARTLALSGFANYAACTATDGASGVKREDGVQITGIGTDVRAITHHIRDDILYGAVLNGANAEVYRKPAGSTVFALLATVAGAGQPYALLRDGDNQLIFYMAAAQGLYKSFDGCVTFYRMRDYSGAGLDGLQVGYGAASWILIDDTIVTDISWVWKLPDPGGAPDHWAEPSYDDSAWTAAVVSGVVDLVAVADPIWVDASTTRVEMDTGSIAVTSANGTLVAASLTPGNLYAIEATGGPWKDSVGAPESASYQLSRDGGALWEPALPDYIGGSNPDHMPAWCYEWELVAGGYARVYWQQPGTGGLRIRVASGDGNWANNTGSLGYRLTRLGAMFRKNFTLVAGVVSSATLTYAANNSIRGIWINNVFVVARDYPLACDDQARTVTIDPAILIPGGDNVIAVIAIDDEAAPAGHFLELSLVIGAG